MLLKEDSIVTQNQREISSIKFSIWRGVSKHMPTWMDLETFSFFLWQGLIGELENLTMCSSFEDETFFKKGRM